MTSQAKAVSAPGKVLLTGGYLVLDRKHTGLVFGLNARIHVHVQPLAVDVGAESLGEIVVRSPQFREAQWRYSKQNVESHGGIKVTQVPEETSHQVSRNRFVEMALDYGLTYVSQVSSRKLEPLLITILADSAYYSAGHAIEGASSTGRGRFVDFKVPLHLANKTGLGSSAALVTAFTAAVMAYHIPPASLDLRSIEGQSRLHNIAQAAHSAAQGKIGSGFDVAAAVYGSCVYRRFSPSILDGLGDTGSPGFSQRLVTIVENSSPRGKWDAEIVKAPAALPKGLVLLMCDVDCGSETVGMVKSVLKWRSENREEADLLWATIQQGNQDLAAELSRLNAVSSSTPDYSNLRSIIVTIRSLIREMSTKANVPIEPEVSTKLIDACTEVPGVVGGTVPGAGGFDAIALIVENHEETLQRLRDMLGKYQVVVEEASKNIGKVRLLNVKQEYQGIVEESPSLYSSWLK